VPQSGYWQGKILALEYWSGRRASNDAEGRWSGIQRTGWAVYAGKRPPPELHFLLSGLEQWDASVFGLESFVTSDEFISRELALVDVVTLLEQHVFADIEPSRPWVTEWGSKCAGFILWHIQNGMAECLLRNVSSCFLDALDEHLVVGRSQQFIDRFGEQATLDTVTKSRGPSHVRREHVVPCNLIVRSAELSLRMSDPDVVRVGQFIQNMSRIVLILDFEADVLDKQFKNKLPPGIKLHDNSNIYARLSKCGITWVPYAPSSQSTSAEGPLLQMAQERPTDSERSARSRSPVERSSGAIQGQIFYAGMQVCLKDLTKRPQLNGQRGTLREFDQSSSRWNVRLSNVGEVKAVRSENLCVP